MRSFDYAVIIHAKNTIQKSKTKIIKFSKNKDKSLLPLCVAIMDLYLANNYLSMRN